MIATVSVEDALKYAAEAHKGQMRKNECGGTKLPYIFHPVSVAQLVWKWGAGTQENMVASLGHDLHEDCGRSFDDLEQNLGTRPAEIIMELSYVPSDNFSKDDYLNSFDKKSINAYVIKLADRFNNSKDFKMTDLKYASKYFWKCRPLYALFDSKSNEILQNYGEDCLIAINTTFGGMRELIDPGVPNFIVPM